jgi:RNA polymerase sigma factor (sigma-70 family)
MDVWYYCSYTIFQPLGRIPPKIAVPQQFVPIDQRSLTELEQACRRETRRYRRAEASDARFCLEIFCRALRLRSSALGRPTANESAAPAYADEEARTVLVRIYSEFIKAQINRAAIRATPIDDLVQQVWLRFWRAANTGLTFTTLEAALNYLKQTTVSMLIEEQRRERKRQRDESLHQLVEEAGEEALTDAGADLFSQHTQRRFRERCREVLADPLEYRVFWLRYSMGLAPREIARMLADEDVPINHRAATPRAVSDLLDRSCKRLQLDSEIRALLEGE